jgi:signal transduction histidine kinase
MTLAPANAVDREIDTWLARICQVLDLDRAAIYERDSQRAPVRTTHTWLRPGFPPFPRNYDPEKFLETTTNWVMAGNPIVFSQAGEIPEELRDSRKFVARYGPKASAVIPMRAADRVIGAASFGKFRAARDWQPELLEQLNLVVRLFGSAIERKQSEAALQAAHAELRIASRRNMMSELVASLAHEINQPLGAILSNLGGIARLLSNKNSEPAMALGAVKNAIEDTKRASEIIRRVRLMFTGHSERKTAVHIGTLAAEVVQLIASEAALRQIAVKVDVAPAVRQIVGDRIQVQQCVLNLLVNAFDAIAEAKSERREVTITVAPYEAAWIRVSVSDSGGGIDQSVADRLFEPFVTTKRNGMGLGLLVTRSIVENHGGKIWLTPNTDGGTTFTFTLPEANRKKTGRSKH